MSHTQNQLIEDGRAAEWLTSAIFAGLAVSFAMPGETMAVSSGFRGFVNLGISDTLAASFLASVATIRLAALVINGRWRRSPHLRMGCAAFGAGVYAALGVTFAFPFLQGSGALSTAVTTYFVLSGFDILASYRAARDAGRLEHH